MVGSARVIGHGRVGSAIAARFAERGLALSDEGAELVLICVPDAAIAGVAAALEPGPWVAHVSGGTPLTALEPHARRFTLHPLQTFTRSRGPEQLDGAWAAVSAETLRGPSRVATGGRSSGMCTRFASGAHSSRGCIASSPTQP